MWWKNSQIILLVAAILTPLHSDAVTLQGNHDFISTGKRLTNQCTVTGTGETFDGWYNPEGNKITATSGSVYVEAVPAKPNVYKLVLDNIQDDMAGTYMCKSNLDEKSYKVYVEFTFDSSVVKDQDIYLNEDSVISCAVIAGNPFPTFTWFKKDQADQDQKINFNLARYTLLSSGSLKINNVVQTDAGNYKCDVIQTDGVRQRESTQNFVVSVVERPEFTERPISKSATAGYSVSFKCQASGIPKPDISWYRYEKMSSGGKITISADGTLTIANVASTDVGEYRCEASNRGGKITANTQILTVYESPTINDITDKTVEVGDNIQILCIAQGDPLPTPQWKRPGFTLNQQQVQGSSTLSLSNIQLSDAGTFTCEASNGAMDDQGNPLIANKEVNLRVQSAPVIDTAKSTTTIYSWIGSTTPIQLICVASGFPFPTFEIRRNNQKVTGTESTTEGTYTLDIVVDEEQEFGEYQCVATNTFGSDTETMTVLQASAPGTPTSLKVDKSCNSITVSWQEPTNDGGVPVTNYKVILIRDNVQEDGQSVDAVQTFHTFEDLPRQTEYTVEVKALNNVGYGDASSATTETNYECPPSSPVIMSPVAEVLGSNSITLKWTESRPDDRDEDITYDVMYAVYNIDGSNGEWTTVNAGSSPSYEVTDLKYETVYSFRVVAKNSGGETPSSKRQYTTPEAPPAVAARTSGLDGGAVAGIIIAIILIILIVVDLFCCFFNKCGFMYCCCQTFFSKGESKESKYAADEKKTGKESVPLKGEPTGPEKV